jgi:hypothetical protein
MNSNHLETLKDAKNSRNEGHPTIKREINYQLTDRQATKTKKKGI